MKHVLALISTVVLVGCLTPSRYDAKYEAKFCEEWAECSPDFACDLADLDYSDCDFDRQAARDCLDGQWTCDTSNTAFPVVVRPEVCQRVYTNCVDTTTTSGTTTTPTDSGS